MPIDLENIPDQAPDINLSGLPDNKTALPVIANEPALETMRDNSAKINQQYKDAHAYSEALGIPVSDAWDMHESISKYGLKVPDLKIPEVNLPYPRIVGPNDDIGQIALDLGLPIGEPSVLGKALNIPFMPVHMVLNSPGAVSEVELATIPEELDVKGSSILDFVDQGAQSLAKNVFPGGYTAEDAGEALDLNPEFAGKIARVATDLGVGYLYAGAAIKMLGGITNELMLQWRLMKIPERRVMLQAVEVMQESGMSESEILKSLRNQGRTAEFEEFKNLAIKRRQVTPEAMAEFEAEKEAVLERMAAPETVKTDVALETKPEMVEGVTPTIPEEAARFQPVPAEPIPIKEIDTVQKLSEEASRKALENIKVQDLKEEKKILSQARKKAEQIIKENYPMFQDIDDAIKQGGFDTESVEAAGISKQEIIDINKKRLGLVRKNGEVKADVFVENRGYDSVDDFFERIRTSPGIKERSEDLAQQIFDEEMIGIEEGRAFDLRERILNEEIDILKSMLGKKPAARKELKGIIRRETGQVKVKDIIEIDEAKALKDQLRLEAAAARKAYSEGKKEAALKHKEKQLELTIRARERKQLKERIQKAAKTISKNIPASVDFYYREAIENLRAGIDPSFRMKKTLRDRKRLAEFLEQNPEERKNIPVKLLKKLEQKTLADYTVDEVEQIAEEIKGLIKLGKLKRKLKLGQKRRFREEVEADIIDTVLKGRPLEKIETPKTYATTKKPRVATAIKTARAVTLRPSRVADKIDGSQDFKGPAHKFFIDKVNDLTDAKLRMIDRRTEIINDSLKKNNLTIRDLYETRTIDGAEYLVDEMLDVYAGSKNARKKLAIVHGNNIPEEVIKKIIGSLAENEKLFADSILKEYDDNYYRLRESVIDNENRDMGFEENYSPMRRTEIDYTTMNQEVIDEILHRSHLKKAYAEKGMTMKRVDIPKEFQRPIRLGLYSGWLEQMPKQEQYINFMEHTKDMHRVLDGDIKDALEQQGDLGNEYHRALRNYVDRVANPNIYKAFNGIENLSRQLRQNTAMYYLSGNLVTMAKQLPSVLFYLPDAGPVALASSFAELIADPVGTIDFVRSNDPQVKHRQIERELEEIKKFKGSNIEKITKKIGEKGLAGIYLIDRVAITIGWKAVYNAHVQELGHEGAAKLARDVTLRTQPQAAAKDLPDMYATNEVFNWFLQFSNQLNQVYNIGTYDIPNYFKNEKAKKALLGTVAIALNALWIWTLTKKRLPESPEDVRDALSDQMINAIPAVGKTIVQSKDGWQGGGEIPPLKGVGEAARGVFGDKKADERAKSIAEGIGILLGIPGIAIERTYKFLKTGKPIELIGGKPKKKHGR